jgi:hypothetical protein
MSVSTSVWLKDILPHTPGVVRSVAKREFNLAAREFFRKSGVWREVVESTYLDISDYTYRAVPQDATSEIVQILSVEVNGLPIDRVVERPVGDRPDGTPTSWYPTGTDTFEVWPTPDQYDDEILVRVILIPTEDTTTLPDFVATKYYDSLLDGTLGRLFAHPAKPYSNPTLGEYRLRRFRSAIGEARGEAMQGGFAGQNWQYPRFGK